MTIYHSSKVKLKWYEDIDHTLHGMFKTEFKSEHSPYVHACRSREEHSEGWSVHTVPIAS